MCAPVKQLIFSCGHRYESFMTMIFERYVSSMSRSGTWGDHLTLDAIANEHIIDSILGQPSTNAGDLEEGRAHISTV